MSDRKRSQKKKKSQSRRRLNTNLITYTATFPNGAGGVIESGTSGVISGAVGFSTSFSSEYSALSTIYSEAKLLSVSCTFTPIASTTTLAQSEIMIGLNMGQNATTNAAPSSFSGVENLRGMQHIPSAFLGTRTYRVRLPRVRNFLPFTADAPTLPNPDAGSPGALQYYGSGFIASTAYYTMFIKCKWLLKSRI